MKKGSKHTVESKIKISNSKKGCKTWNKNIPFSEITRKKMSISATKRRPISKETRIKISKSRMGQKIPLEVRKKMSKNNGKYWLGKKGINNPNWIDGRTPKNVKIRTSIEYKLWRDAVLSRDGYRDQKTGKIGGNLVVHHILNFSNHPELRFAINNGITLSKKSHEEFHKIYGKNNNTQKELEEFILDK